MEYITAIGIKKLNEKLEALKASLPEVMGHVASAREMGDLSENAEYHAARERKRNIENEIGYISSRLQKLQVINPQTMDDSAVRFGFCIKIKEKATGEISNHILVGVDEIDFDFGDSVVPISFLSPIGKALIGKKVGEEFVVSAPSGDITYSVVGIWRG